MISRVRHSEAGGSSTPSRGGIVSGEMQRMDDVESLYTSHTIY
jgi:hypothetical protein